MPIARLDSRALIRISGPDARPFLHNLLTQNIETLQPGELRFGALLSPPGRLMFDLFIWGEEDGVILDVAQVPEHLAAAGARHGVGHQPHAGVVGGDLRLEIGEVAVFVAVTLRLAEPDAVDDRRVVQLIADHGVLGGQQGLEQPAIGVEAR